MNLLKFEFSVRNVILSSLIFGIVSLTFWLLISRYVLDLLLGIDDFYGVLIGVIFTLSFPILIYFQDTNDNFKIRLRNAIISFLVILTILIAIFYGIILPTARSFTPSIHV
ncbi:MAG: hypothetical protein KC589_04525 [Nanoarchaeota archaeon]|nr:hypothetical protein [Nanoarchaeota archaeon]